MALSNSSMLSELLLEFDAIACSESVQMAGEQEKVQGKVQAQRRAPEKTVSVDARSGIARSSFKIGRERLDKEEDEGRNRGTLEVLERGRAAGFEDTPRTEHRAIQIYKLLNISGEDLLSDANPHLPYLRKTFRTDTYPLSTPFQHRKNHKQRRITALASTASDNDGDESVDRRDWLRDQVSELDFGYSSSSSTPDSSSSSSSSSCSDAETDVESNKSGSSKS